MTPFPHTYSSRLTGGPDHPAELSASGVPALRAAPPRQFDGPGDAWSPEQLLLAAVASCFLFTLRAVARVSKYEFTDLQLETTGTVDRQERITRFTNIELRAVLTIPSGADRARAMALLEKTKSACLVSASLSVPVHLDAEIREAPALVSMPRAS
jgi:organic hydroperoxide reductase OsmC/OhrA